MRAPMEPKQRADHLCARRVCREPLPLLAVVSGDPFCTTECCRDHYGVRWADDEKAEAYATARARIPDAVAA